MARRLALVASFPVAAAARAIPVPALSARQAEMDRGKEGQTVQEERVWVCPKWNERMHWYKSLPE